METNCRVCGGPHVTGACTEKPKTTGEERAVADRVTRLTTLKIDETPAYEEKFLRMEVELKKTLEGITSAEISAAIGRIDDFMSRKPTDHDFDRADDTKQILTCLSNLKVLKNKRAKLEEWATRKVYVAVSGEEPPYEIKNKKLEDAIFLFSRAVTNLAQARFPEELTRQAQAQRHFEEVRLKQAREKIGRMNVR